jgi:hypothetical protein
MSRRAESHQILAMFRPHPASKNALAGDFAGHDFRRGFGPSVQTLISAFADNQQSTAAGLHQLFAVTLLLLHSLSLVEQLPFAHLLDWR